jgi:ELWxxDGT repeat protein
MGSERRLPRLAGAGLLALALMPSSVAAAPQAQLVKDLNLHHPDGDGEPLGMLRLGQALYFSAADAPHGRELWKTDGTAKGTELVKDLVPGPFAGDPRGFTVLHDTLFFFASDPANGTALWRTSGTATGTEIVRAVPGGAPFGDGRMRVAGDVLFFLAGDTGARQLWRSDGTAANTASVAGPWPDGYALLPEEDADPVALGDALFFLTGSASTGDARLWRTVGTAASTSLVMAVDSGAALRQLTVLGDAVCFARDDAGQQGLYRTSGTAAGTTLLAALDGRVEGLTAVAGALLFRVTTSLPGGLQGSQLWRSDGTTAGTSHVTDVGILTNRHAFVVSGGRIFFNGQSGATAGLWTTDGTAGGTHLVRALPGDSPGIEEMVDLNGTLLFTSYFSGASLWRSDGSAAGTAPVSAGAAASHLTPLGSSLVFQGTDAAHGAEPWRTDGTEKGTVLLRDIAPGRRTDGSRPLSLTDAGGALIFLADDGVHGRELWKSDGTATGTALLADLTPGPEGAPIDWLAPLEGTVLLGLLDPASGRQVWAVDGEGPRAIASFGDADLELLRTGVGAAPLPPFGGAVYVAVAPNVVPYRRQLWRCDAASCAQIREVNGPLHGGASDGRFLYVSEAGDAGGVYRTDGTPAGTRRLADLANAEAFVAAPERVFFRAGADLFVAEPSADAPRRVAHLGLTGDVAGLATFPQAALGGEVFGFVPFDGPGGARSWELWKSDGTPEGTASVVTLPGDPSPMVAAAGQLFFSVHDGDAHAWSLWVSDGTAGGTRALPGHPSFPNLAAPTPLPGGGVIFEAGYFQPWISDGTAAGTRALGEIGTSEISSMPDQFTVSGGHVFYTADDGVHGRELWALPWSPPSAPAAAGCACGAGGPGAGGTTGGLGALAAFSALVARGAARRRDSGARPRQARRGARAVPARRLHRERTPHPAAGR